MTFFKIYALYIVDWSGGWATPWGSASQVRPWSEQSEWSGSSDAPRKAPSRNGNQPHVLVMSWII